MRRCPLCFPHHMKQWGKWKKSFGQCCQRDYSFYLEKKYLCNKCLDFLQCVKALSETKVNKEWISASKSLVPTSLDAPWPSVFGDFSSVFKALLKCHLLWESSLCTLPLSLTRKSGSLSMYPWVFARFLSFKPWKQPSRLGRAFSCLNK